MEKDEKGVRLSSKRDWLKASYKERVLLKPPATLAMLKKQRAATSTRPQVQARIQMHLEAARLNTHEIIGTLVAQMRVDLADILPEDETLKAAKKKGVSHLIKKIRCRKRTIFSGENQPPTREEIIEVEVYSAQTAAKILTGIFGLQNLPAPNQKAAADFEVAVDRLMQRAEEAGIKITREAAVAKLEPLFKSMRIG